MVLDGDRRFTVEVDPDDAFDPDGVRVRLDGQPFHRLDVVLSGVDHAFGSAGLAEVRVPGLTVPSSSSPRPPRSTASAPTSATRPWRLCSAGSGPTPPSPSAPTRSCACGADLDLPGPVRLTLSGTVRLRPAADDGFGRGADGHHRSLRPRPSEHLPGDAATRGSAAFDGDPTTAWTSPFVGIDDQWLEVRSATSERFSRHRAGRRGRRAAQPPASR